MHENTTTAGLRTDSHEKLEEISEIEDESMTKIVSRLIDEYYEVVMDEDLTESERVKIHKNGGTDEEMNAHANFEL